MSTIVQVPKRMHPRQIEFGPGVERSKKGALYFVPGSTKTITDDEYKWLCENHKSFAEKLVVVATIASKKKSDADEQLQQPNGPKHTQSQAKKRAEMLLKKKEQKTVAKIEPPQIKQPTVTQPDVVSIEDDIFVENDVETDAIEHETAPDDSDGYSEHRRGKRKKRK